jgi:hypothetical protein
MPTGGTREQQLCFRDNFKMELVGANYPVMGCFLRPNTFINDLGYTLPLAIFALEWHIISHPSLEVALIKARLIYDSEEYLFTPGAAGSGLRLPWISPLPAAFRETWFYRATRTPTT